MALRLVVGRDHLDERHQCIEGEQDERRGHRHLVPAEFPPHQLPRGGPVEPLVLGADGLGRTGVEGFRIDVVPLQRDDLVHRLPPSRMRGSRSARRRSEMSMPTTVSSATNMRMKPARNWSWLFSAESRIGPDGRQAQDQRHQHRAGDEVRQEVADIRDERVEGHAEGVFQQRRARREPLGLRGHVVLLAELVEQVGAHAADHGRGSAEADHEGRHHEVGEERLHLGPGPGLAGILRIVEAADRYAEPAVHVIEKDQGEEKARGGKADIAEEGREVVADGILPCRRIDRDRDRDQVDEDRRPPD